ncbi:MAG: nicotinamide-nucleotide amidohydrolase family protein [Methylophilaceae bacterium]
MDNSTNLALSNLSAELGQTLQKCGYVLSLAESCTGGMVSATITNTAGSSTWFDRGFITYSNVSKQEMLGVSANTLEQFGAVSENTAEEMALGAIKRSPADIAVSITGIAGPGGGSTQKPVGTVCFAWGIKNGRLITGTEHFTGNRQAIRQQAVIKAITGLLDLLKSQSA